MDKTALLALIATFSDAEKATFAKSLGYVPPGSNGQGGGAGTGLTAADLDRALEPFRKSMMLGDGTNPSLDTLEGMARLDVTGFLGEFQKAQGAHFNGTKQALDVLGAGFAALVQASDTFQKSVTAKLEEFGKLLQAPAGSSAVMTGGQLNQFQKGGNGAADGGRVLDPNAATKFDNMSADHLLGVLRKGMETASDPARKSRIAEIIVQYESGMDFDPAVIESLDLTF